METIFIDLRTKKDIVLVKELPNDQVMVKRLADKVTYTMPRNELQSKEDFIDRS